MLEEFWNRLLQSLSSDPPMPPDDAAQLLREFLRGKDPDGYVGGAYARPASGYNKYARVVLSGGGYDLLFRIPGEGSATYLLNMDHPIAPLPVETWRAGASVAARDVGVELLPVSETAYRQVAVEERAPRLVHREGFEAVFTVSDDTETKYYLSGYDAQESPPLYFLCRLPHGVATVDEAREALKPDSVRTAAASGATVKRQGDLFFIETGLDDNDVKLAGKVIGDGENGDRRLYGTAHYADAIAQLPRGVLLAKGTVGHAPRLTGQNRGPDHHDLILGNVWWMVARNTVPAEHASSAAPSDSFGDMPTWLQSIYEAMAFALDTSPVMRAPWLIS